MAQEWENDLLIVLFISLLPILNLCLSIFLTGLGYILNPDFSFVKIAAPYAQVQNQL